MTALWKHLKTISNGTLGKWIILVFFLILTILFGGLWAAMRWTTADGKIDLGGGTTFDLSAFKEGKSQLLDVRLSKYSEKTIKITMENALALASAMMFVLVILMLFIIRSIPKQTVDLYEWGMTVKENGTIQETLYKDIPYSLLRSHRGVITVLGFKTAPEKSWIVISGIIAESLIDIYEEARMNASMELFEFNKMVPFISWKVGTLQNAFRAGLNGLFPKNLTSFALGKEHSEFNGKTYKNSEVNWSVTDIWFSIKLNGTKIFTTKFADMTNPSIGYYLLSLIDTPTVVEI